MQTTEKDLPTGHRKVLSVIPKGSDNAIQVNNIRSLAGMTSETEVRQIVSKLVKDHGYMIAGSNERGKNGYYLIETEEERQKAVHNLMSRIREMSKRARVLRGGKVSNDQIAIDDVEVI